MTHLIFDFIFNILEYSFLILYFFYKTNKQIRPYMVVILISACAIFTPISPAFHITILFNTIELIFVRFIFYTNLKETIKPFMKFVIVKYILYTVLFVLHSILLRDFKAFIFLLKTKAYLLMKN